MHSVRAGKEIAVVPGSTLLEPCSAVLVSAVASAALILALVDSDASEGARDERNALFEESNDE